MKKYLNCYGVEDRFDLLKIAQFCSDNDFELMVADFGLEYDESLKLVYVLYDDAGYGFSIEDKYRWEIIRYGDGIRNKGKCFDVLDDVFQFIQKTKGENN